MKIEILGFIRYVDHSSCHPERSRRVDRSSDSNGAKTGAVTAARELSLRCSHFDSAQCDSGVYNDSGVI